MIVHLSPPAKIVPEVLRREADGTIDLPDPLETFRLVTTLVRARRDFGITRIGAVTRLDRIGLPVVQVVRPLALSNAVTQGKGETVMAAAAAALMESIETWAAERIPFGQKRVATASGLGTPIRDLYRDAVGSEAQADWDEVALEWLNGWDLISGAIIPVPAALVDTVYTLNSPHPYHFPRNTTGLGGGSTFSQAVIHAGLEILERDARAKAQRIPHFFERHRVDLGSLPGERSHKILTMIRAAGFVVGVWILPVAHGLPVYWCHIMEEYEHHELVPLPAEGAACDISHDTALARALMEACQARLTAISGAREDVTRAAYPKTYDRKHLAEWRALLASSDIPANPRDILSSVTVHGDRLASVAAALKTAGAQAFIVVPLLCDFEHGVYVVRIVAPPLESVSEA